MLLINEYNYRTSSSFYLVVGLVLQNYRIMCTTGGLGRHIGRYIGRLSTDYRSTIGRQLTDRSADSRPINVHISADALADSQSIYRSTIDRQSTDISADSQPINVYISGDALVNYRSIYQATIGRLSVDCRLTVGRLSTDSRLIADQYIGRLSAYMLTEATWQYTYSTHDPNYLGLLVL